MGPEVPVPQKVVEYVSRHETISIEEMMLSGYKYKIKEIKDPRIIKKLKEGKLPVALTLPS